MWLRFLHHGYSLTNRSYYSQLQSNNRCRMGSYLSEYHFSHLVSVFNHFCNRISIPPFYIHEPRLRFFSVLEADDNIGPLQFREKCCFIVPMNKMFITFDYQSVHPIGRINQRKRIILAKLFFRQFIFFLRDKRFRLRQFVAGFLFFLERYRQLSP